MNEQLTAEELTTSLNFALAAMALTKTAVYEYLDNSARWTEMHSMEWLDLESGGVLKVYFVNVADKSRSIGIVTDAPDPYNTMLTLPEYTATVLLNNLVRAESLPADVIFRNIMGFEPPSVKFTANEVDCTAIIAVMEEATYLLADSGHDESSGLMEAVTIQLNDQFQADPNKVLVQLARK